MCTPLLKPLAKVGMFGLGGLVASGAFNKKKPTAATTSGADRGQTVQASGNFTPYGTGG